MWQEVELTKLWRYCRGDVSLMTDSGIRDVLGAVLGAEGTASMAAQRLMPKGR
jgi:hypothetical protein